MLDDIPTRLGIASREFYAGYYGIFVCGRLGLVKSMVCLLHLILLGCVRNVPAFCGACLHYRKLLKPVNSSDQILGPVAPVVFSQRSAARLQT